MRRTDVVVIGGGQAGLAMSRCLCDLGIDHVVLERGRVAERWRSERWESLRLLTPNWQSRLPGFQYSGSDPDGFMGMTDLVGFLERYAGSFLAPVELGTAVRSVTVHNGRYRLQAPGRRAVGRCARRRSVGHRRPAGGRDPRLRPSGHAGRWPAHAPAA
ncbi:MAG TPA: FAD-dependent monooxygenase [Vicinamibacterales bacterium]|nr:FAD-dependent monooxygenase [Vicinamibacterales bacterium]